MDASRISRQDPWAATTQRRLAKLRSTHVSCWTAGDESEGMWRLYCADDGLRGRGVALQSTLGALETSIAQHNLAVSPITYRHYHEADPRTFTDELDPFMHKRMGFQHENEVRLLRFDSEQYHKLLPDWQTGAMPPAPPELPTYMFLEWRPEDAVERIIISPYADDDFEADVRDAIARADRSFAEKVERSILDPRRYAAQY